MTKLESIKHLTSDFNKVGNLLVKYDKHRLLRIEIEFDKDENIRGIQIISLIDRTTKKFDYFSRLSILNAIKTFNLNNR